MLIYKFFLLELRGHMIGYCSVSDFLHSYVHCFMKYIMKITICSGQAEPEGEAAQVMEDWSKSCSKAYYLMVDVGQITIMI